MIAAAEARLAKSVLFSDTVAADITITGSLTVSGVCHACLIYLDTTNSVVQ